MKREELTLEDLEKEDPEGSPEEVKVMEEEEEEEEDKEEEKTAATTASQGGMS